MGTREERGGRDAVVGGLETRRFAIDGDGFDLPLDDKSLDAEPGSALSVLAAVRRGAARPRPRADDPLKRGWASRDRMSSKGGVTLTPTGSMIARLVEDWMRSVARDSLGGTEIRTPLLHRWGAEDTELMGLASTFERRIFKTADGGGHPLMLRYSADPGFFAHLAHHVVPCTAEPQRIFEICLALRRNRPGERRPMERLDEFVIGDHHTLCGDVGQALAEYARVFRIQHEALRDWGTGWTAEFTTTEDDLEWARTVIVQCARFLGTPILMEVLSGRKHYWGLKHVFYDQLATRSFSLQYDDQNGRRYDIRTDGGGHPIVLHAALATVERWLMYASQAASLPADDPGAGAWFRPVGLRILPVSAEDVPAALAAAETLSTSMRVDVDDREWALARRVRTAIRDRVLTIGVIGEAERTSGTISVRQGRSGTTTMTIEQIRAAAPVPPGNRALPHHPLASSPQLSRRWVIAGT